MTDSFRLRVKFWGVRGSTPTPHIDNLGFGGNTACIEVRTGDGGIFFFDAGTGARDAGISLIKEFGDTSLCIKFFLTHFHWDHIQGIPFFTPLYGRQHDVTFFSSRSCGSLREILEGQMAQPYFPVNLNSVASKRDFVEVDQSRAVRSGHLTVHPFPLNHPQGCFGYRIEAGGAVVVYASDLEHGHPKLDAVLREYAQNANILIYDAQYTPSEYEQHRGWGHSTWLQATKLATEAHVEQLILTHHDPSHNDQTLMMIVRQARQQFDNTLAAREGWEVEF